MADEAEFLSELASRVWAPVTGHGFTPAGLFLGHGAHGLEVAVARSPHAPTRSAVLDCWKARKGGRAAPVLLVVLHPGGAALCGAAGETPPVHPEMDVGQVERLCRETLAQPDRHAALRFLSQALPSLETALPGLNNEGLLALQELQHGVPARTDWPEAKRRAERALGTRDRDLLGALGFTIEHLDNLTSLLRSGDRRTALAVMLRDTESAEAGTDRFNGLSPISYGLKKADDENLPWVVLVQGDRLRLYATAVEAGVGRRGRTETYIECQPALLSDEHLPYLWLLFSAEALAPDGSLGQVLEESRRFAGRLAERLRERIYEQVVPALAQGVSTARRADGAGRDSLGQTYEMALIVLFRLLFIAYAEDRDLLPYRHNDAYRRRSLKQKAQELAACVAQEAPIAAGESHWREFELLCEAVAAGNAEWGVPAYDGGLFTGDPDVSSNGAAIATITLPNESFEAALRHLLVIDTAEGVPGPVDFRSLGVREFGTIYEGLLESELGVAETDLALDNKGVYRPAHSRDAVAVAAGETYLHNRSGVRKSSGSYYTKSFAVEHLLEGALESALDDHFARLRAMDEADAADAFFDFRVADIAMGSGHFLIAAIDRIEKRMADALAARSLPGVRRELDALRGAALTAMGELGASTTIEDGPLLRRLIARRCIYGVDVFGYRVGARKSAKWCAASCAGADTWSMARGSGRGGGSKAPRREQEPRDKRIEELQRENVKLNEDLVRTIRDRDRWKRRSEHLEKQLDAARRAGRRQAAPFAKDRRQGRGGRPGRRPGAGYGRQGRRRRPPRVDETHAARVPKACPACGGAVEVARVAAQYQEDLPPVHPIVRRFDIEVGHCSQCRRRVQGRHRLQTSDALGAASVQLGPGAVSLAVELHTELGVPLAKVAHVLRTRFGVHVTPGGLARLLHRAARDAGPAYRELCRQVRNAPVVTPDETGWRVGAKPHWLWTCVTPETTVYAICPGRSFDDAATLLGTDYSGVLVRDGWVVYRCYKGLHQSCINHLANRCRKLREGHPRSPWGPAVLRAGLAARDRCNAGEMSEHGLASVRGRLEARLGRLIDAPPRIPDAQRFANHLATEFPAVFLFLRDPSIDATNWRAEQAIRPAVVIRKVCGGNRTRQGADTQQVLSSVVRTARQRGLDLPRLITEMLRAREPVVPEAFGLPPPPA